MSNDEDLIRRARVGDELAFEELWRRHSGALLEFAQRAGVSDVHDLLAGAYLDASRRIAEFEGKIPFGRWLRAIVEARAAGTAALAAEMQQASREAMAKLPRRHREVLRLLHEERLAPEDAAIRMGATPDEVRSLHQRALARYAELIRGRKR